MPLPGKSLEPREIARLCHDAGWRDLHLVEAVAVCLSESNGYPLAYNDNKDTNGDTLSRDVGLFEINIPASEIGSAREKELYGPVKNIAYARDMYLRRGWEPWYGYTNGYAMSTKWYRADGKPSGRFLMRALRGVANFYAEETKVEPVPLFKRLVAPK